jgi:hypothetical protein
MSRPLATVSVDVDSVDLHLVGYGITGLPPDPSVYSIAVPRLLERFQRHDIRATFFIVARDAAQQARAIASIIAAGHEVASHSFSHPLGLECLDDTRLEQEIDGSRRALEHAAGTEVLGFRAPNFDLGRRVAHALVNAGYRYDASGFPTPLLLPARLLLAMKSRDPATVLRLRSWPIALTRCPHTLTNGASGLIEFPAAVTPWLRIPVYHTARYFTSGARFLRMIEGFALRGESLSYPLHAVDALGLAEDQIDPRLGRHPGMEFSLVRKFELLDECLAEIKRCYEVAPFRDRLGAEGERAPAAAAR